MNILFLSHRVPFPPNKGDKLRSFHFLDHLSTKHNVWCASFVDDARDFQYESALKERCEQVRLIPLNRSSAVRRGLLNTLRGGTMTEGYYADPSGALGQCLAEWSQDVEFDAVFSFSSSMAPWGLQVRAKRRVLDLCDLDSAKWSHYSRCLWGPRSWMYRAEGQRLARRELDWIKAYDLSLLVSDAEAADLPESVKTKVRIVSNGVDLPTFKPDAQPQRKGIVGFVGVMDYFPNIDAVNWFARRAWPQVHRQIPQSKFQIVGRHPASAIRKLKALAGIDVIGEVADVGPYVRDMSVSIAPLRIARGIQNKVLEAMAFAKPVVVTPEAAGGLGVQDGVQVHVANDADTFANRVIQLLSFPSMRQNMGAAARQFVSTHHTWGAQLEKLDEALSIEK